MRLKKNKIQILISHNFYFFVRVILVNQYLIMSQTQPVTLQDNVYHKEPMWVYPKGSCIKCIHIDSICMHLNYRQI